jgi:hypothetical protein
MRKMFLAALFALLPVMAVAKGGTETEGAPDGIRQILWISAGVVAGVVLVDLLFDGVAVAAPVANVVTPAMQEARAAGAVFGEQIAAATGARDAEARADMLYALLVGTGALLGGWVVSHMLRTQQPPPVETLSR